MVEYELGCGKKKKKKNGRVPLIITSYHGGYADSRMRRSIGGSRRDSQVGFADSQREIMISILVRGYRD